MMKLTALLCTCFFLVASSNLYSQTFEVPDSYELKVAADYARHCIKDKCC